MPNKNDEEYSEEESVRRREEVLKRMVNTPPKPLATRQSRVRNQTTTGEGQKSGRRKSDRDA